MNERQPQRLRADQRGLRLPPGPVQPGDVRRRAVGEEVEHREGGREHRRGDRQRRQLGRAEVPTIAVSTSTYSGAAASAPSAGTARAKIRRSSGSATRIVDGRTRSCSISGRSVRQPLGLRARRRGRADRARAARRRTGARALEPAAPEPVDVELDPCTDGIAVVRDGALLYERYGGEMEETSLHLSQSVGKSVLGLTRPASSASTLRRPSRSSCPRSAAAATTAPPSGTCWT